MFSNNPDIIIFTTSWREFVCEDLDNYGFVNSNRYGLVEKIVEKPKENYEILDLDALLIGTFWFKSSEIIKELMQSNKSHDELYIAKTIGENLSKFKVFRFNVDYWFSLGTPKELQLAQYWFDYFSR